MADSKKAKSPRFPTPEFEDSSQLRWYLNQVRGGGILLAILLHLAADEAQAACESIPDPDNPKARGFFAKARSRRKAKRVAKHLHYSAECAGLVAVGAVRTWGAFKKEYAPDLKPVRGTRRTFRIVDI
jgi:hypothetical protein